CCSLPFPWGHLDELGIGPVEVVDVESVLDLDAHVAVVDERLEGLADVLALAGDGPLDGPTGSGLTGLCEVAGDALHEHGGAEGLAFGGHVGDLEAPLQSIASGIEDELGGLGAGPVGAVAVLAGGELEPSLYASAELLDGGGHERRAV